MFHFMITIIFFLIPAFDSRLLFRRVFFLFNVLCQARFTPILFTVSIATVGAEDLDDPCGLSLFPA